MVIRQSPTADGRSKVKQNGHYGEVVAAAVMVIVMVLVVLAAAIVVVVVVYHFSEPLICAVIISHYLNTFTAGHLNPVKLPAIF